MQAFLGHLSAERRIETPSTEGHCNLRHDLVDQVAVHIGQSAIDAVMSNRQLSVVDSQQVQHRRMHIVTVGGLIGISAAP